MPTVPVGRAQEATDLHERKAQTQQGWSPKVHSHATAQSHPLPPLQLYEADAGSLRLLAGSDHHFLPRV